jgi:hypothetical protein
MPKAPLFSRRALVGKYAQRQLKQSALARPASHGGLDLYLSIVDCNYVGQYEYTRYSGVAHRKNYASLAPSSLDYLCFALRRAAKPRAATEKNRGGGFATPATSTAD